MIKVALAGNPNCGKTTLFNALTGSSAHVGNWPGVTVDKKEGTYKKGSEEVLITDLPGIYSLSPYTPEEVIARNFIIDEQPDCVIDIVDATNLERNLYLTTQLLEMDVPIVVALNMIDVLAKNADKIDVEGLSKELGVPVVAISATKEDNIESLMDAVIEAGKTKRSGRSVLEKCKVYPIIKKVKALIDKEDEVTSNLFHAIKLVENDEIEKGLHPKLYDLVLKEKESINDDVFESDLEAIIADYRYKYIQKHFSSKLSKGSRTVTVVDKKTGKEVTKEKVSISDRIDRVLTNRVFGLIFFVVILFVVFHLTFGEDLFYLSAMGVFDSIDEDFALAAGTTFEGILFSSGGIQSPGVFLQTVMIGFTDWITELVGDGLLAAGASNWAYAFICDGILAGIFSVASFLPQILLLFLFFSFLEDSGYMARVAFILDRIFRRFGVSGRAFMPMIMGFGCSVPAMTNTRTLATEKERIATVRVIPFFSCSAKLPILTACAGALVTMFGVANADVITLGMYLTGVVVAIVALLIMRNTTLRGETPPFIMELPAYHLPQFKSLMLHLWDKTKHFVKKAFTIILVSNIIIWFLQSFTPSWQYIEYDAETNEFLTSVSGVILTTNDSILAQIGMIIQPLFTPLGFGSQLGTYGWVFAVGAITGLIAKENVIATFAMLGAVVSGALTGNFDASAYEAFEGASDVAMMIEATGINIPGLLAFIVFNMTTIPCFAAVATARAELKKGTLKYTVIFWLITSYIAASAFYLIGTWVWTIAIYVVVIAIAVVLIYLYNKKHPIKAQGVVA